ncbi:MAG TPA: ABC transporter permease [Spirochaetia bacterium]|nr:ABC transporter permease [Spirochaetia bacterium]
MFYIKMAMRNIFRNSKRTFLTGLIIGVGLASLMFMDAMTVGMKQNLIASVTSTFLGDAQIHAQGFQATTNSALTVQQAPQLVGRLRKDAAVRSVTERSMSLGTASSAAGVESIVIYGIAPDTESDISQIDEALEKGDYLETGGTGGVLLGTTLADRLEVGLGDRIVLTVSQAASGDLSQNLFRVRGIFNLGIKELDESVAFITLPESEGMLGIKDGIHEIALTFHDPHYAIEHGDAFKERYSRFGNVAQPWFDLVPQIKSVLDMTDFAVGIMIVIVFAVIVFGIVNTLFMSLYERLFEFGVLRAVGTRSFRLGVLIVTEAAFLALYAIVIGIVLGLALNLFFQVVGIDYSGIEFAGATFRNRIYTVLEIRQFTLHPLLIMGFTVLVSLYPARHAARMKISRALQRSL